MEENILDMPRLVSLLLITVSLLFACSPTDRQDIDLSDQIVKAPVDGIGHYVYSLSLPVTVAPGEALKIQMEWRTVGPVDPTSRYAMEVVLEGPTRQVFSVPEHRNTIGEYHLANWLSYDFPLAADMQAGTYIVGVRIRNRQGTIVPLGYKQSLAMGDTGFYRLGQLEVGD